MVRFVNLSPPYFVVVRNRTDSVNNDVLAKYGPEQHRCLYQVERTDFDIKEVLANQFVKVVDQYLFQGGGSGPDGEEFVVYDLKARTKLYQHVYMGNGIGVTGGIVSFTERLDRATRENCKDYDRITKLGLSATIEADVSFKLDDLANNKTNGEPGGARTRDHRIKSAMLYQLSYRP